jgi:hypothetical protein
MIINTGAGDPINNSPSGAGSATTSPSVVDIVAVTKMLKDAGLTLADMGSTFSTLPANHRRAEVLAVLASKGGLTSMELTFLLAGKATIQKPAYESAVRRLKAGVGILPSRFLSRVESGKVVVVGNISRNLKALLETHGGGVVRCKTDDLLTRVNDGFLILLGNESQVEVLRAAVAKSYEAIRTDAADAADAFIRESVMTPQRLMVDKAIEVGFTADILGALLPKATVVGDKVRAVYG